jgi:endogenous inhibitor of DNA gyrase (YacG/DUF329 family)
VTARDDDDKFVCPICKITVRPPADPQAKSPFPFCSERCKLIDLGRWLNGRYQIPTDDSAHESSFGSKDDGQA